VQCQSPRCQPTTGGAGRPASQATFEPDEPDEPEEDEPGEDEPGEDEDDESDEDDPLEALSEDFLSLVPDLSDDPPDEDESPRELLSDFLLSDPFAEASAASEPLRLSVR
jgi:hypothetical protein